MDNREAHYHSTDSCTLERQDQYPSEHPVPREVKAGRTIGGQHCKTHNIDLCHCGWEWSWHVSEIVNIEKYIKSNCFLCGVSINHTVIQYKERGNICRTCIKRCDDIVHHKLTESQADRLLKLRRKEVMIDKKSK